MAPMTRQYSKRKMQRMSTSRRLFLQGLVGSMAAVALAPMERRAAAAGLEPFPVISVVILSHTGRHRFDVELAESTHQRMQGLQGRRTLDPQAGMLFVFESPMIASMWMKDTHIPLDMLFLEEDGAIIAIARDTRPMSLQPIQSPQPVKAVLEVNAGTAKRLGIEIGHRVLHPILRPKMPY
jgi:uncharacterized protein